MEILEVETDKIASAVEAADPGTLRRKVAAEGEVLPVKALLGVMADAGRARWSIRIVPTAAGIYSLIAMPQTLRSCAWRGISGATNNPPPKSRRYLPDAYRQPRLLLSRNVPSIDSYLN